MRLPALPPRPADSHKGDYGRALIIGGSLGMAGSISLAGMAALRTGAGLVTLAVPNRCLDVVAGFEPSYMTIPLPSDAEGRVAAGSAELLLDRAAISTCVGLGPGLGRSASLDQCVARLYRKITVPLVVDADGLNALAVQPDRLRVPGGVRVLTPHPVEFRRLTGGAVASRSVECQRAHALAAECGVIVLLKGHETYITDGTTEYVNTTGNPGMATGGAGDVLTGMIVALLGQGMIPFDATCLAAHLHGRAGDLAAASRGEASMIARDIIDFLPAAMQEVS